MTEHPTRNPGGAPGHETRDVALRPVLYGGIGLIAITAFFFALIWGLFVFFKDRAPATSGVTYPLAAEHARTQPPAPRLQSRPRDDLLALHAWEDGVLGSYAWVDRGEGIARVPIDRAMELFLTSKSSGGPLPDLSASQEKR